MVLANGYSHSSPSATAASSTQNTPGGMAKDEDESMDHASGSQSHAESEVDELEDDENASEAGSDAESEEDERNVLKPLHIEVRLSPHSTLRHDHVKHLVSSFINANVAYAKIDGQEIEDWQGVPLLKANCESVKAAECAIDEESVEIRRVVLQIHVYQPSRVTELEEFSATTGEDGDEDGDGISSASVRELPATALEGVWDTLIYDDDIKNRLLNYIYTTLLFSDANVDFNVVTWNRVVLLHGPPGTGKTSLCRALAQKLAIRLSDRYPHGKLIEINSHSLFSKWFSESGKLVQRLFSTVTEMVEDESGFVVVLIDEVESLTAARAGAGSGTEPSDALRVVNALLTQLDKLKNRKNVLIMTTSNIAQAIDSAFVDRADIKQYIGLPPPQAIYWILCGCLKELMRSDIVQQVDLADPKSTATWCKMSKKVQKERLTPAQLLSVRLYTLAGKCEGMSGRTLRRLPVLAHARYISLSLSYSASFDPSDPAPNGTGGGGGGGGTSMKAWLGAMEKVVRDENEAIKSVKEGGETTLV